MIVDDNPINCKVISRSMAYYGMNVDVATGGSEAITMCRNKHYDLIFMDHMMPEMDGIEATRIIRSECGKTAANTIIIALTANAIQGAKELYLENGFADFLSKPFERSQIHQLLERWIPENKREYV